MNETIKAIYGRRSTRGFKPEQIKREDIEAIINCGLNAPSAVNAQNWHFTVLRDKDFISRLNKDIRGCLAQPAKERMTARNSGDPDFSMFYFAPTVVVVSMETGDDWAAANCGMAVQNMLVAAESLGIGSCVIGMAAALFMSPGADEYVKLLDIPGGYAPRYCVSFGYKAVDMPVLERAEGRARFIPETE